MSSFDFAEPLARIGGALTDAGVPYMVIGGQAVIHHGEPRYTKDIDLTLAIAPFELDRALPALEQLGLLPAVEDAQAFVDRTHVLPLMSSDGDLRLDMSFTNSAYEEQAIAHGVDVVIHGVAVRFASADDLLIHKIIAWRPIDQKDVQTVLLKNPGVDLAYIRHWLSLFAEALEQPLLERLEQGLRDAGMVT